MIIINGGINVSFSAEKFSSFSGREIEDNMFLCIVDNQKDSNRTIISQAENGQRAWRKIRLAENFVTAINFTTSKDPGLFFLMSNIYLTCRLVFSTKSKHNTISLLHILCDLRLKKHYFPTWALVLEFPAVSLRCLVCWFLLRLDSFWLRPAPIAEGINKYTCHQCYVAVVTTENSQNAHNWSNILEDCFSALPGPVSE